MKDSIFTIVENRSLTPDVNRLVLRGDTSAITLPGQFINIRIEGCFLRRPLSVCWTEGDLLSVVYRIQGKGTALLSGKVSGDTLQILTGLGNGFDTSRSGEAPLLIGGGTGASPMYGLAKALREEGKPVSVILGFASSRDVMLEEDFRALGCDVTVTTADGSYGVKGFVTDAMTENFSYFYTCGPEAMFRAICRKTGRPGELSFEARMGCGFGACMGCTCKTLTGYKRICKDGPVLRKEELTWED